MGYGGISGWLARRAPMVTELPQRIVEVVQKKWLLFGALGFLSEIIYLQLLLVFKLPYPSPGTAVVWLTLSAGLMSLQPEMQWKYKVLWIFILGCFGVIELRSIDLDRTAREAEVSSSLERMEQIFRSTLRIERLVGSLPPPVIQMSANVPTVLPTSAIVQFDHTAMFAAINPVTGMISPFVSERPLTVNFYFSNHGSGVAHKVLAAVQAAIYGESSPDKTWENKTFVKLRDGWRQSYRDNLAVLEDLPPGESRFKTLDSGVPINDELADNLSNGRKLFYVFGIVSWKDGTGAHQTDICSWLQPPGNPATWHNCVSGHNTIQ
jgi:hypothetical protein